MVFRGVVVGGYNSKSTSPVFRFLEVCISVEAKMTVECYNWNRWEKMAQYCVQWKQSIDGMGA